jgi:hypothetical protein
LCLVAHLLLLLMRLVLLVCLLLSQLPCACGFDLSAPFVDDGLVFCVRGGVAAVKGVVECSAEGFSCAL